MLQRIYDVDTLGPHIPDSSVKEIFNSIVKIKTDSCSATGFFLKIKIRDKELNCLITNCHVISQIDVFCEEEIYIYYGSKSKEITKVITLNSNERYIRCFDEPKDITVIEIKNYDYIPDHKFLLPDLDYKNGYSKYYNEKLYLAGYPGVDGIHNGERHISSGRIFEIYSNNIEFDHTLNTKCGSSGSPICLLSNGKVIGVNKAHKLDTPYGNFSIKVGTFIGVIIDELKKDYYSLPEKRNNYGYNSGIVSYNNFGLSHSKTRNFFDFSDDFFKFDNSFENTFNEINTLMNKTISNMMNMALSSFKNNNNFFNENNFFSSNRSNNFTRKEKKLEVNRNKTPIGYNRSYYGLKESLNENYSDYNYTTQNNFYNKNNNNNDYNNSLIRNKSFEPKLKKKKNNKKNYNKGVNEIMNNINIYTSKHNKEGFKYSPYDQSLNYYKSNNETKKIRFRNNNNCFNYISKSYDNTQKSICKKNDNLYMNISTINNKIESYQYNNDNSFLNYNYSHTYALDFKYI